MNTSYLTVAEYKRVATGIDINHLDFTDTSQAAQDAELANVIARASGWIDNYCNLDDGLYASTITETMPVMMSKDGFLRIRPNNIPIVSVSALNWRLYPNTSWTVVDPVNIAVYERYFETMFWYPMFNNQLNIQGSFAFPTTAPYTHYVGPTEAANYGDLKIAAQYTYVQGYPNTWMSANAPSGATTLTIEDSVGMIVGTRLTIYDGANTETVVVSNVVSATSIQLSKPTLFAHASGVAVSSIPSDVKQACILITNYLLKERGVNSITMDGVNNPEMQRYDQMSDLKVAEAFIKQYRRVI